MPFATAVAKGTITADSAEMCRPASGTLHRKVDVRLPGKGKSNSHGTRPVYLIITMIKWIRTSRVGCWLKRGRSHKTRRCRGVTYPESNITKYTTYTEMNVCTSHGRNWSHSHAEWIPGFSERGRRLHRGGRLSTVT